MWSEVEGRVGPLCNSKSGEKQLDLGMNKILVKTNEDCFLE